MELLRSRHPIVVLGDARKSSTGRRGRRAYTQRHARALRRRRKGIRQLKVGAVRHSLLVRVGAQKLMIHIVAVIRRLAQLILLVEYAIHMNLPRLAHLLVSYTVVHVRHRRLEALGALRLEAADREHANPHVLVT